MMNNSEETIQKVLAGLRDAEVPPGLARRIREAAEDRASTKAGSKARGWRRLWLPGAARLAEGKWAWRVAFAGMIAVSLAIVVARFGNAPTQQMRHSDSAGTRASAGLAGVRHDARVMPLGRGIRVENKMPARKTRLVGTSDSASPREMRAASHPAPEAPLTQEEKLLLRVVNEGDPQQMAMLNPEVRAIEEAKSEAKFQEFVEQSIKGDRE